MSTVVVFDIETIKRKIPDSIKQGIVDGKVRADRKTKDPQKIWDKLRNDKWHFTAEGAYPICVGFGILDLDTREVAELIGMQTDKEADLAEFVVAFLNERDVSKIVGYNSKSFDMPILEVLIQKAQRVPLRGFRKYDHIDLIFETPQFCGESRPLKNSPVSACALYGIKHTGGSGADVRALWQKDQENGTKDVLKYCLEDVQATGELFFKMSKLRSLL